MSAHTLAAKEAQTRRLRRASWQPTSLPRPLEQEELDRIVCALRGGWVDPIDADRLVEHVRWQTAQLSQLADALRMRASRCP